MTLRTPKLSDILIFAGDARFAAQISAFYAKPGTYIPIVKGLG